MYRGENSDSIALDDLIPDILARLPAKSIARFRCVSKLWASLLCKPYFTDLFLTRSSARPRLLIGVKQEVQWFLFSSPQPQNPSSLVVAADFHMEMSFDIEYYKICGYASGLLYFPSIRISEGYNYDMFHKDEKHAICNPSTGQYAILPEPRKTNRAGGGFLGFDPIGKQFKVLVNGRYILTLGTENLRWRRIKCPFIAYHHFNGNGICINGILYYVISNKGDKDNLLSCFDVRSEKVQFISPDTRCCFSGLTKLINYKGKLGLINMEYDHSHRVGFPLKLHMCVLEDIEKREFSAYVYILSTEDKVFKVHDYISVVGATASGEIVLVKDNANAPFYVFYFNLERNILRSVEIQGVRLEGEEWSSGRHQVHAFVDHVEDLKFDVTKKRYAATFVSAAQEKKLAHHLKKIIK